ncbi:MAG TPA: hypothetical protein VK553_09870, partial [Candidatus Nitrosopolaris rasttigaisensis]|nr:hypothetical protein [Candidatus Nitrosopolaris rasttigaisensis]
MIIYTQVALDASTSVPHKFRSLPNYQGVKQSKRGVHLDQDKKSCYTQRRREKWVSEKKRGKSNGQAREAGS